MRSASYVYLRPDTGSWAFRFTIPMVLRALLGKASAADVAGSDQRTLGQLVKAYLEASAREDRHTEKTKQEVEAIFSLVLEVMGTNTPVAKLSRADFARFKDILCRLPSNR